MTSPQLRLAEEADLAAINDIYNYYVPRSTCTYQLEPESIENREAWFREHHPDQYPVIVAELDGDIIGWGSLSRFRLRAAYAPRWKHPFTFTTNITDADWAVSS